ncbi:MAG: PorV/PorQ family protein, partial [Bacteroidetes bacterium]|nr:PorV/PorQ family protein [Bacteroidota bacterium]
EPYALAVQLVYGKELSEEFSVGGRIKYANQNLGNSMVPVYNQVIKDSVLTTDTTYAVNNYSLNVLAFDFGTIYKTGLKSLAFGMSISNFSREIAYERESFQLPLTFRFGISMNIVDFIPGMAENNSFVVSIDAVHPRSYSEFLNIGGEYIFMKTFSLRAGYVTKQDDYGLTLGLGVSKFGFAFDYSYTPHKIFNNIQRFSLSFSL